MVDPSTDAVIASEQIVLGAAMLDTGLSSELAQTVTAGDFYQSNHQVIWQAITAGGPIDPVAVAHRLMASGELIKVGGAPYLHTLIASVPTTGQASYHARQVAAAAERRRAAVAAARIAQAVERPGADLVSVIEAAKADLAALGSAGDEWPDPVPLSTSYPVPLFPTDVLPDWVEDMVRAVSVATQTPADLAGSIALACLSTATMGRVVVEPWAGWQEQTTLFTCCALPPGNRKSVVFDMLTKPIRDAERDLVEELWPQVIETQTEKAALVRQAETALAAAGKTPGDVDAMNQAKRAALEADEYQVVAKPMILADDITPEATKTMLAQQGGRASIMSAEGGIFQTIAGRYSGVPDLDVYLKGHAGEGIRVTRKSGPIEEVDRAALTMGLAVQPSVLTDIGRLPGFESRGFLARFLFTLPKSTVGYRDATPPPVPAAIDATWHRRIKELTHTMWSASTTVLTLTPEAQDRVVRLEIEREPRLRQGGEWEPILAWASKLTGTILRIAGLMHVADNITTGWRRPITAESIDAAAYLGHHYAVHALAVWGHMTATATGPAPALLDWLKRTGRTETTRREIHRALNRRLNLTDIDTGLALLEQHGYIRIHRPPTSGNGGRRPSPRIHLHPSLTKTEQALPRV